MDLILNYCKNELEHWKRSEILWMTLAAAMVVSCTVFSGGDSVLGIVSALTGVAYTLLAGKGKSSCYLFGAVNTLLYGYIAYRSRIYGDMLLNWGYYFPMQFIGLYFWTRHRSAESGGVIKRRLSLTGELILLWATVAAWYSFALVLKHFGAFSPFIDSATTVLSIASMVLGVMRCFEQWIGWTLVNGLSIILWYRVYITTGESLASLLMWVIFLICGLFFARQWLHEIREEK